ncbi:terminase small subunit [Ornithinibacillus sp. 4-3]|uniref:Terminase small subunit n=1 Tax=Ornithinibacillus sp. 4-3 TaxID=3231488 RepID=A0AB39HRR9_9BACI
MSKFKGGRCYVVNWDRIREDFETSTLTLKALADKHNVKLGTLKSRKSREGWSRDPTKKDATKIKKVATPKNKVETKSVEQIEPIVESDELTEKQGLFCIYYVKSFNATQSAIKAGYAPESAHVEGSRLLRNVKVSEEIRRLKGELQQGVFIDAMDVLNKYIQIAFADITDYATFGKKEVQQIGMFGPLEDEDGNPLMKEINYVDFNESSYVDGTIITEVKQGKEGISIKLADKMKAMDMLSKYFDLLSENDQKRLQKEKLEHSMKIEDAKLELQKKAAEKEKSFNIIDNNIDLSSLSDEELEKALSNFDES